MRPVRVAVWTLGCKVNQYDSESIAQLFRRHGFSVVGFEEEADLYVINTCAVTATGEHKSRQLIRRAARRARGKGAVMVTGCLAQLQPGLVGSMDGVVAVVGTDRRGRLVQLAAEWAKGATLPSAACPDVAGAFRDARPAYEELPVACFPDRARAVVKIQDGCDEMCTFCIVPYSRGRARSREAGAVLDEVRRLVDANFHEIVLSGVNVAAYGRDLGQRDGLLRLLERIEALPGSFRIRLGSVLPSALTCELLAWWGGSQRLCPHIHLSLQSGDDGVLRRMGRRYRADDVRMAVGRLREMRPDLAVTADVIVGFPGETEEAFGRTVGLVEELGTMRLHLFPFSPRPGTPAAHLSGRVDGEVAARRMRHLSATGERAGAAYLERLCGREVDVLVERPAPGSARFQGVDEHYARVELEGTAAGSLEAGRVVRARVVGTGLRGLRAVVADAGGEGRSGVAGTAPSAWNLP